MNLKDRHRARLSHLIPSAHLLTITAPPYHWTRAERDDRDGAVTAIAAAAR